MVLVGLVRNPCLDKISHFFYQANQGVAACEVEEYITVSNDNLDDTLQSIANTGTAYMQFDLKNHYSRVSSDGKLREGHLYNPTRVVNCFKITMSGLSEELTPRVA